MLIIFSYTVSELVNFLRHMAETLIESSDIMSCLRHGSIQDRLCRTCCWAVLCSTCSQHITSRCLVREQVSIFEYTHRLNDKLIIHCESKKTVPLLFLL